jgi:hypothetical protein
MAYTARGLLRCESDMQHQPIIGQLSRGGQPCTRRCMSEVMAHVCEVGAPGANLRGSGQRLRDGKMRRVRCLAQRIEHEDVESLEQRPRLVWNPAAVGQVREPTEAQSEDRTSAVEDGDGYNLLPSDAERSSDREQLELRDPAAFRRRRIKGVREHRAYFAEGVRISEAGNRLPLQRVESPHLVEAEDVIGMPVREQQRIDAAHIEPERLGPEIRSGIDEQVQPVIRFHQDGGAQPVITRVGRPADGAIAPDHRHAVRRACTQEGDVQELTSGVLRDAQG